MKLRSIGVLACLAAVAILGAACGSDTSSETTPPGQSTTDPRSELEAALEKSAAENSSRTTIEATGFSSVNEYDRSAEIMHSIGSVDVEGVSLKNESLIVDGVRYWRSHETDVEKAKWTRSDLGDTASTLFGQSMFDADDFFSGESKVTLESPGRYRVEGAGDAKGLFGSVDGMSPEAGQAMTVTVNEQGLIGKIEMEDSDGKTLTVTFEFGIKVEYDAPAADEIEKD